MERFELKEERNKKRIAASLALPETNEGTDLPTTKKAKKSKASKVEHSLENSNEDEVEDVVKDFDFDDFTNGPEEDIVNSDGSSSQTDDSGDENSLESDSEEEDESE